MNILNKVTWKAMWKNRTRTLVTIVGIILSAAMFTAVTTLGYSLWSYLVDIRLAESGDYFLRYDYTTDADRDEILAQKHIRHASDLRILGYSTIAFQIGDDHGGSEVCAIAAGDDDFFQMVTVKLEEGRLPQNSSEIVITRNVYNFLKQSGVSAELGDSLTLQVTAKCPIELEIHIPSQGSDFERAYTIVGISEKYTRLEDRTLDCSHLFTYADENTEPAIWHRVFIRTLLPVTAEKMLNNAPSGTIASLNYDLTALYGSTQYGNINVLLWSFCLILIAIIMVGSVSLIYNAFAISVSERTKQFGLLSSIGATKKQIRSSVRFEALALAAIGIPVGMVCGYLGIAVTVSLLQALINSIFSAYGLSITVVPSALAFVGAGLICLITVLLSARKPAKWATKASPLSAIRQTQDYQVPAKRKRSGDFANKKRSLPVLMAKKYYIVSKRKYRATVLSLVISIALFISAVTFGQALSAAADNAVNTQNFDILLYYSPDSVYEEIRQLDTVTDSALWNNGSSYTIHIPQLSQNASYWQGCQQMQNPSIGVMAPVFSMEQKTLRVIYLEDSVLRSYLEEQNIDPEPYFNKDCPTTLITQSKFSHYTMDEKTGEYTKQVMISDVLSSGLTDLEIYPTDVPKEVMQYMADYFGQGDMECRKSEEDIVGFDFYKIDYDHVMNGTFGERCTVQCIRQVDTDGTVRFAYYLYDAENKTHGEEPILVQEEPQAMPTFQIGASVAELPYGISTDYYSDYSRVVVILPLSAASSASLALDKNKLSVSVSDHEAFLSYIAEKDIPISDHLAEERTYRNGKIIVDVFSYGFILLITLICIANVFNTISTNIALRRRDFGMLRSIGMTAGDIHRMMIQECLIYGFKALLWGLPIGIVLSLGIQKLFGSTLGGAFTLPWAAVLIAAVCVFAVVFTSMSYAVAKLRKDNPIEAIRTENI